jgi:hypothetical protein
MAPARDRSVWDRFYGKVSRVSQENLVAGQKAVV